MGMKHELEMVMGQKMRTDEMGSDRDRAPCNSPGCHDLGSKGLTSTLIQALECSCLGTDV